MRAYGTSSAADGSKVARNDVSEVGVDTAAGEKGREVSGNVCMS